MQLNLTGGEIIRVYNQKLKISTNIKLDSVWQVLKLTILVGF